MVGSYLRYFQGAMTLLDYSCLTGVYLAPMVMKVLLGDVWVLVTKSRELNNQFSRGCHSIKFSITMNFGAIAFC